MIIVIKTNLSTRQLAYFLLLHIYLDSWLNKDTKQMSCLFSIHVNIKYIYFIYYLFLPYNFSTQINLCPYLTITPPSYPLYKHIIIIIIPQKHHKLSLSRYGILLVSYPRFHHRASHLLRWCSADRYT